MENTEMREEARELGMPRAYTVGQICHIFKRVMSEADIRAAVHREKDPLPCVMNGAKRPVVRIYSDVFAAYLLYRQGVADYAEVDEAARRCLMGARS